jgi:phospholipase A1
MIRILLIACCLLAWLCGAPGCPALAEAANTIEECATIVDRDKRLDCFDDIARQRQKTPTTAPATTPPPAPAPQRETQATAPAAAETTAGFAKCKDAYYSADRLRCYDKAAGYSSWECLSSCVLGTQKSPAKEVGGLDTCKSTCDDSKRLYEYDKLAGLNPRKPSESSYLSKAWLLDPDSQEKAGRWAILSYRENYFLYTYNFHLDKQPYESVNPGTHLQNEEAKFQLSVKIKLGDDLFEIFGKKVDLWAGYTQLSVWQMTNWNNSAPFRETNYEPELFIFNVRMDQEIFGWTNRFIQFVPINHQSNGQSEPLSRSWNRTMLNFGFERANLLKEKDNFDIVLKTWYRWPESAGNDDNPDIESYLGYGELWAGYHGKICDVIDYNLSLMFRNNLRFDDDNRSALQLGIDSTLIGPLNWYIQYFTGYGETLIDYNHYTNRIGVGVMIRDW